MSFIVVVAAVVQVAWAANDYSVQDCIDHEVYTIIGRHGTNMVARGIIAAEAFHAYGFERASIPIFGMLR